MICPRGLGHRFAGDLDLFNGLYAVIAEHLIEIAPSGDNVESRTNACVFKAYLKSQGKVVVCPYQGSCRGSNGAYVNVNPLSSLD